MTWNRLIRMVQNPAAPSEPTPSLTPREDQVKQLIAEGLSNKEIASRLGVAVHTVKSHVHNVLAKLRLHTRLEVAVTVRDGGSGAGSAPPRPGTWSGRKKHGGVRIVLHPARLRTQPGRLLIARSRRFLSGHGEGTMPRGRLGDSGEGRSGREAGRTG